MKAEESTESSNGASADPVSAFGRVIRYCEHHTVGLILAGLLLGIVAGLFFGERCSQLRILGDAYVRLLQMTVLPYIVVALVRGFGQLSLDSVKRFAVDGGRLVLLLWCIGVTLSFALATIFPNVATASFFSSSALQEPPPVDTLGVFIPANPFAALAGNIVPAVVLFSICIGVALIGVPEKQNLLDVLENLDAALSRVTKVNFKLAPIGIFAISAAAAGTLRLAELSQLQVYLTGFLLGALLVVFVVMPTVVAIFTPIGKREFLTAMWPALLLGFSAGSSFVVLPLLRDALEDLFDQHPPKPGTENRQSEAGIIIPVSYNFPLLGSTLNFLFILFTAWFYKKSLTLGQDLELILSGILNLFGSTTVAIPFLLDQFRLPADAFELYMMGSVVTDRLAVAGNIVGIGGLAALYIAMRSQPTDGLLSRGVVYGGIALAMVAAVIGGTRLLEDRIVQPSTADRDFLVNMEVREKVPSTVIDPGRKPGGERGDGARRDDFAEVRDRGTLLAEIHDRGVLRVGYTPNSLPFAFVNGHGDLAGFDIAHAHRLAKALKCELEFVPFSYSEIAQALRERRFDIAMSSVSLTESRLAAIDFTRPYLTVNAALVMRDHLRANWINPEQTADRGARIAVVRGSSYAELAKSRFPWATLIEIDSRREFFESNVADVHLTTAEQGAAWTLLYPSFSVVMTEKPLGKDPLAYAIPQGEPAFREYLNQWLTIIELNGFAEEEYNRWILGQDPKAVAPRWCIARDVLGWLE